MDGNSNITRKDDSRQQGMICFVAVADLKDLVESHFDEYSRTALAAVQRIAVRKLGHVILDAIEPSMEWRLESDEHGRPFGVTLGSRSKVYLSFTHSGNHVAAAASVLGPIGIDIEQHRPGRDVCRLADMAFGLNEKTIVAAEGYSSFYRFWTLREAVSKAAGVGMPMVIDGVDRFSSEPDQGYWQSSDGHWLLAHFRLNDSVNISLALDADHVPKLDHWSSSSVAWLDSVVIRKQLGCSMTDRPIGQNRTSDA